MRKLFTYVLILTVTCSQLWASPGPDQKHADKIRKKVIECVERDRRVTIETYDDRRLQGSISEAAADTFVVTNEGRSTTLTYAGVKSIKSPMSAGKKRAIVTAIVTAGLFGLLAGAMSQDK